MFISGAWGQIDSVLTLGIVAACYLLLSGRYELSGAVYGLAILIKPQALMFGPLSDIVLDLSSGHIGDLIPTEDMVSADSLDITTKLETELPEFPGVLFRYSAYELTALEDGETATLYQGMPIWNVYLADLNGDGKRELCSSAAFGSGLIDNRIKVYDYANGASYELSARGETDYGLVLENGVLCATMTSSSIASEEKADRIGRLVLAKENGETSLRIEDERPYETRDASSASDEPAGTQDAQAPDLDAAIASAVLAQFSEEKPDGLIHVESYAILEQQELSPTPLVGEDPQPNQLTVYLWTLAQSFRAENGTLSEVSGVSQPAALTFELGAEGYALTEYWTPRDGSAYLPDLRARFPESALELALAYEGNTEALAAANLEKARRALEETGGAEVLVERLLDANPGQVAAVIVEPVAANMGVVPPKDGFLQGLRDLCDKHGSLLIFDEVITGFRLAPGGAQAYFGVRADLVTFGKIIGGGMPVGAYAGSRKLMEQVAPCGPVYQAGTLSGNPVAMAAGLAQLDMLAAHPEVYDRMAQSAAYIAGRLRESAAKHGVKMQVNQIGSLLCPYFTETPVDCFAAAKTSDTKKYAKYFNEMLSRGVYLAPSQFEAMFVSAAHTQEDLEATVKAAEESIAALGN